MLTSKSLSVESGDSWLLSKCRIGGDDSWGIQCDRGFRYCIHATAPNMEPPYATEMEDTIDWHLPPQRLVSYFSPHNVH